MENEGEPPQEGEKVASVPTLQESMPPVAKVVPDELSSYEAMIKMFPLSTFLVLLLLIALKSDHVTAWWGIAAYQLSLTDFQFGVVLMAAAALLALIYWIVTAFRKRNQQAVESRKTYLKERAALLRFFEATGGVGAERTWKDRTYWGTQEPLSQWKGVFLNPYTKRVHKLILGDNGLTGMSDRTPMHPASMHSQANPAGSDILPSLARSFHVSFLAMFNHHHIVVVVVARRAVGRRVGRPARARRTRPARERPARYVLLQQHTYC